MSRPAAISFNPFQNASSRLTLVLWPAMTIECLKIADFSRRLANVDPVPRRLPLVGSEGGR